MMYVHSYPSVLFCFFLACDPTEKNTAQWDEVLPEDASFGCPGDVQDNVTAAGGEVYVYGNQEIIATFYNGSADYHSRLSLVSPDEVFIGQQNNTPDGTEVSLGTFTKGQKLIFSLAVPDTGATWYSGPASENTDGFVHARIVQAETQLWYGGFEDLVFAGDKDYNDVCFSIRGDVSLQDPGTESSTR